MDDAPSRGAAFLVTQLGTHCAAKFAVRAREIGLTPPQVGILGLIARSPGQSQQAVATALGLLPSRLVGFVDDLEDQGLLERVRSRTDRRNYALQLTEAGRRKLGEIGRVGREHEQDIFGNLTDEQHTELVRLLQRVADEQGLTAGVHPGFRSLNSEVC
ncbi:MarR family winged helix-turn-helix transcriptional regulator [Fodinicola acaciae]|uniref:MarR family winged helix-turn-helix transcriptional regulator n=1 Tax=Fodinicola acaciae TaxID=2681555 RepID=UPI0013CFA451|nr:MarR family transcriptional regulator [Fodinicola acaciae]